MLVFPEVPADVGRAEGRDVVADAALRRRGAEAVGVANDPVRHETAVAAAGDVYAPGVDPAHLLDVVDGGHQVLVVLTAPVADARLREPLAVGMTAARIGVEHGVTAPREHLELVEKAVAVRAVRTAVDLEHQRPLLRRLEPARLEQPALDLPAVRAGELDALGSDDAARAQQLAVHVGDDAQ